MKARVVRLTRCPVQRQVAQQRSCGFRPITRVWQRVRISPRCEYRRSEQTKRAQEAEDRARQESETRKVLEQELNRLRPQK